MGHRLLVAFAVGRGGVVLVAVGLDSFRGDVFAVAQGFIVACAAVGAAAAATAAVAGAVVGAGAGAGVGCDGLIDEVLGDLGVGGGGGGRWRAWSG